MAKPIKYSIIVPVYNTDKTYLKECFNSIIKQTYDNYEVIIVNDGSNDTTKKTLDKYVDKYGFVLLDQKNQGLPASRINGLKKAKGDYVIFLDSDDVLNTKTLEIFNSVISEYKPDVILHDFVRFKESINNITYEHHWFNKGLLNKEEILIELLQQHINSFCTKCGKRTILNISMKNIDTSIVHGEDQQQSAGLIMEANSFYYTDENIYYYRVSDNEKKDYYKQDNINDVNFLVPTYKKVFVNNQYDELKAYFKTTAINVIIYTAFKLLKTNSYKNACIKLDELNNQEIISIINSINKKAPLLNELIYKLINNKQYLLLKPLAIVYNKI